MFRRSFLLVLVLAALSGCGPAVEATFPAEPGLTLTDGLGRSIHLDAPAGRIISLAPSNTEILFAVGASGQVVGRDQFSDYPEAAAALPVVGGSMGEYDLEAILALEPDLVLAQAGGFNSPELVAAMEELGLVVFALPNPVSLEEMYANLRTVADLSGHAVEAAALITSLEARVAAVDAAVAPLESRPRVYYELDANTANPASPYTAGPGSFVDLLIARAGGANVGAGLDGPWTTISVETLLVSDPEIILLGDSAYGVSVESVAGRPGWERMSAVANGQVYPFDDNLVSRPGPRLVDGLEALVRLLHPGLLP